MTTNTLSIFALGGLHEIGKNMYVVQYGDDLFMIDCGVKFAGKGLLGVDLILPDFTYLEERAARIKGLIVTHGHEDHIGGIPYLLKKMNIPIFASRFTLGLIELKLGEHRLLREARLIEIDASSELTFEQVVITFFKTSHSIPDCLGIVFETPLGKVVHTGDFKFDLTPANDAVSDLHKMAAIGGSGVLVLLSESTNAERAGLTPSESVIAQQLQTEFLRASGKIFISTFASNINRIQQIIDAAERTNRRLVLLGRSMVSVVHVALKLGVLRMPSWMLTEVRDVRELLPERLCILCTGSQGEMLAALSRLSTNSHRDVKVSRGDTVIFAASPIPGNERDVSKVVDQLFERGATVIYGSSQQTGLHVSGHGYQEDLKLMLTLMKPKYFMPIHGEYRMLYLHKQLAEAVGVQPQHSFLLRNGEVVEFTADEARQGQSIEAGDTYVDDVGTVGEVVLRDRKQLAEDGMLLIVVTIRQQDGALLSSPEVISRGFVYARECEALMTDIQELAKVAIEKFHDANIYGMKRAVKSTVDRYVYTVTNRRPMILPIIMAL